MRQNSNIRTCIFEELWSKESAMFYLHCRTWPSPIFHRSKKTALIPVTEYTESNCGSQRWDPLQDLVARKPCAGPMGRTSSAEKEVVCVCLDVHEYVWMHECIWGVCICLYMCAHASMCMVCVDLCVCVHVWVHIHAYFTYACIWFATVCGLSFSDKAMKKKSMNPQFHSQQMH